MPDGGDLAGVDARLHGESAGRPVLCFLDESVPVGDVEVDGVDGDAQVGAGGEQDGGPRVHGDVTVAAGGVPAGTSAERGYQVFGSPHEADGVADGGDGRCGQHSAWGLAERENPAWCEGGHLLGRLGLGEHHGLVRGVGECSQVLGVVVGAGRVDPYDRADRVE